MMGTPDERFPTRWARVHAAFDRIADRSIAEQDAEIESLRHTDPPLAELLWELLLADRSSSSLLDAGIARTASSLLSTDRMLPSHRVGPYRYLGEG